MSTAIRYKIARARDGARLRVLDLFSGCGGFSLGFDTAGFEIVAGLEKDPVAAQTHGFNFFGATDHASAHAASRDATTTEPSQLARALGLGRTKHVVDTILAGPPCQSYARVGRAKLREIAANPDAFLHDRRGKLYERLIAYVGALEPLVVVFENVPDVLNQAGKNVVAEICGDLEGLGYVCRYTTLNAAHYGVPQMRERVFLIAYHRLLELIPTVPPPTHWIDLPEGYHVARNSALKPVRQAKALGSSKTGHYVAAPRGAPNCRPAVSAEQALSDLPVYTAEMKAAIRPGARRFTQELPYRPGKPTAYARLMRHWPGFEGGKIIRDHVIRRLPRDYPIFSRMKPGDKYPEAHRIALELWGEQMAERGVTETGGYRRREAYLAEKARVVPPYDPSKFVDKWRKMAANEPVRTLTAHLGQDSYTHIHYDDQQARTLSVREAARLQSFPDGFMFMGAMNAAFRQIGNAVPPLLALALARHIANEIAVALSVDGPPFLVINGAEAGG